MIPLSHHISFLREFFYNKTAISLGDDKAYLIENRLVPIIKKFSLKGFDELISEIKANNKQIVTECIDAISTNETYFFRDLKPFKIFENEIIPFLANTESPKIRIWSAACSSGQEPYSLAISLYENRHKLKGKQFEIIATDISSKILSKAKDGVYSSFEIQRGLPVPLMIKYFEKIEENNWKVKDEIKKFITFREQNLTENIQELGLFDCIFCRYVLIYFDDINKKSISEKIAKQLKNASPLVLGTSETHNLSPENYTQHQELRSIFFKK